MTNPRGARNRLRSRSQWRDDQGMSLILVIGFSAVLSGLIALAATTGIRSLRSSAEHVDFESSLTTAEAGVDTTLDLIAKQYRVSPTTPYVSASPCNVPAPTTSDLATAEAERTWARDQLTALADAQPGCLRTASEGQFLAVRPAGTRQTVYSMGWFPRKQTGAERRLIKADYLFAPFKPAQAVLTDGDLDFSGSLAIQAVGAGVSADVHTNEDMVGMNVSLVVQGAISASGTIPESCPSGVLNGCSPPEAPAVDLPPDMTARGSYNLWPTDAAAWWDLCPDGSVRTPSSSTPTTPCSGTTVGGSGFNGWEFDASGASGAPTWTLPRTAAGPFPGTYYVFQGDAEIGSTGLDTRTWPITVLAEAKSDSTTTNTATCNKLGGNIVWKTFNMVPRLPGLQLVADANITGDANSTAGPGFFFAGDKIDLQTSSATLSGAVIAANACDAQGLNTLQGVTLLFSGDLESPVKDVVRTTLWLEYPAG